jgi:hypothetical protein
MAVPRHLSKLFSISQGRPVTFEANQKQTAAAASAAVLFSDLAPARGEPSRRSSILRLFQRAFQVPDGVDADKIEASFKNGVLMVTLPKSAQAQKTAKKIDVKAA